MPYLSFDPKYLCVILILSVREISSIDEVTKVNIKPNENI